MSKKIKMDGYMCEKCGRQYPYETSAILCCKEYRCRICGTKTRPYTSVCDSCHELNTYEKAAKMTYKEYVDKYGDNMVVFNDEYYSSIEEVIEYCEDKEVDIPKYVWGTDKERCEISVDTAIENALENSYEDAEFGKDAERELERFIEEWNEKYGLNYYVENNVVVFVPEDMRGD